MVVANDRAGSISVLDLVPVPFGSVVNFLILGHSWLLIKSITFLSIFIIIFSLSLFV